MTTPYLLAIFGMAGSVSIGLMSWILVTCMNVQRDVAVIHKDLSSNKESNNLRFKYIEARIEKLEVKEGQCQTS